MDGWVRTRLTCIPKTPTTCFHPGRHLLHGPPCMGSFEMVLRRTVLAYPASSTLSSCTYVHTAT